MLLHSWSPQPKIISLIRKIINQKLSLFKTILKSSFMAQTLKVSALFRQSRPSSVLPSHSPNCCLFKSTEILGWILLHYSQSYQNMVHQQERNKYALCMRSSHFEGYARKKVVIKYEPGKKIEGLKNTCKMRPLIRDDDRVRMKNL